MRGPLETLREEKDKMVGEFVPSPDNFDLYQDILPILEHVQSMSELLSSDKVPTMHRVIICLVNLGGFLARRSINMSLSEPIRLFATKMIEQVEARVPEGGTRIAPYRVAHLLHPKYRGVLMKQWNVSIYRNLSEFIVIYRLISTKLLFIVLL